MGEEVIHSHQIKRKDTIGFNIFIDQITENLVGGETYWYRINLDEIKTGRQIIDFDILDKEE